MALYTAQYRYSGQDRLDITVKGNCVAGRLYAPTWEIVSGVKDGRITEDDYIVEYFKLLDNRHNMSHANVDETRKLVEMVIGTEKMPERDVTLVCFCPPKAFCHRHLLVAWLKYNFPQIIPFCKGERV